ncbi:hypothetical protein Q757_08055 [Oenococcus alcoholitolerans]|uniref:HTH lacI-type domain-containing protein n=2 Tax=Oenococcus alcoholitolerans TaxID=931074 RepID=A0ABR4XPG1_9LACO|nr:hypothetical protein Q757_08055 [Oenococcus alcoholitolerans]
MTKMTTISDVAKEAGVSITTVSRFLNGHFNKMSRTTKIKVDAAIKKLNYFPLKTVRRWANEATKTVGLILCDTSSQFSSFLFTGAFDVLHPLGFSLMLFNSDNSALAEEQGIEQFVNHRVDGMIIEPSHENFLAYSDLVIQRLPLVMVDRRVEGQPEAVNRVISDNFSSSFRAGIELVLKGYQRILLVGKVKKTSAQNQKVAGFKRAAKDFRIQVDLANLINKTSEQFGDILERSLGKSYLKVKTAVVVLIEPLISEVLDFFSRKNIYFPEEIGLLAFDDSNWATYAQRGGIDLIKQDSYQIGKRAALNLISYIQGKPNGIPSVDIIATKRIHGSSLKIL